MEFGRRKFGEGVLHRPVIGTRQNVMMEEEKAEFAGGGEARGGELGEAQGESFADDDAAAGAAVVGEEAGGEGVEFGF